MDLQVSLDATGDRTTRLYQHLLDAVLDGRLSPGDRLPPTRALATQLGVARGTVAAAYDRLAAEGFLEARTGAGTFVSAAAAPRRRRRARTGAIHPAPRWATLPPAVPDAPPAELDLSVGGPDMSLFPLATWRRVVSSTLRPSLLGANAYASTGHEPLRVEVARFIGTSRSVVCGPQDVLLTNGAQQGLDLVARALVAPGTTVAVEDPGYTAASRLFHSCGATVVGVPVDDEGLVVDSLPANARIVYVTPSHQFPTGAAMSLERRMALLEWASRRQAVVVEDDYDSEFRFEDRPLEPLQSLDRDGRVVYVGSFSKILMPLLRVGYLVAPESLQDVLFQAKQLSDWQGDVVTQGALARFMSEGLLAAHLRRAMKAYRPRRQALLDALAEVPELRVLPSSAGLHVCTLLRDDLDDVLVARRCAERGVALEALSPRFLTQPARPGLVMGFRHVDAARVPVAVDRVAEVLQELADLQGQAPRRRVEA